MFRVWLVLWLTSVQQTSPSTSQRISNHLLNYHWSVQSWSFDMLDVCDLDRLARTLPQQRLVEGILTKSVIQVVFVLGEFPDTPEGVFLKSVHTTVAKLERLKTVERTARGSIQVVKTGNSSTIRIRRTSGHATILLNDKAQNPLRKSLEVRESVSDTALSHTMIKMPMSKQPVQVMLKKHLKEAEMANISVQTRHSTMAHIIKDIKCGAIRLVAYPISNPSSAMT